MEPTVTEAPAISEGAVVEEEAVEEQPAAEEAVEGEPLAEAAVEEAPAEVQAPAERAPTVDEALFEEEDFLAGLDLGEDELDESLPDWLTKSVAGAPGTVFDWGDDEKVDVTGWLRAEEEVTQHEMKVEPTRQAAPAEPELLAGEAPPEGEEKPASEEAAAGIKEPAVTAEAAVEAEGDLSEMQPLGDATEVDRDQLERARHALYTERYESALAEYEVLVQTGKDISILISDLQRAARVAKAQPEEPRLRRLLGDAYMENGQLQKALEEYQQALELL